LCSFDGFAGRGTYSDGKPGSPLNLHGIARDVVAAGIADEVELLFVERDADNHAQLTRASAAEPVVPGVVSNPPEHAEFAAAPRRVLGPGHVGKRPRPAFWFVDPFGFSGMPLSLMRQILAPPRSEVFITFMVREANRFLETPQHQPHIAETLGLSSEAYERVIATVRANGRAAQALRDLYQQRLLSRTMKKPGLIFQA
jgi:three-Cys-motif partner protein